MAKPETRGKGRPTDYLEVYNEQARKLGLLGYTDKKIADFFCVSETTLNNWKRQYPNFLVSLKAGKEVADMEVTASLYERAIGYSHTETKVFNNQGEILTHDVQKIYPPDPISIKYWLNNRQPEVWREKVESEIATNEEISKIQIEVIGANVKD